MGDIMTFFVRRCLQIFLIFELFIFLIVYCFGPKSLKSLKEIQKMQHMVSLEIVNLESEVSELLQNSIKLQSSFAKEKIARERLLMKKNEENVYFKNKL